MCKYMHACTHKCEHVYVYSCVLKYEMHVNATPLNNPDKKLASISSYNTRMHVSVESLHRHICAYIHTHPQIVSYVTFIKVLVFETNGRCETCRTAWLCLSSMHVKLHGNTCMHRNTCIHVVIHACACIHNCRTT
jgi:hypothetical protein